MQICDVTRSDEVVGEVIINANDFGDNDAGKPVTLEVGQRALDAFRNLDWQALHQLTPASLRKKDPAKSEAAKKAGQTRAANRAKNAPEPAPAAPSGPSSAPATNTAPPADDGF